MFKSSFIDRGFDKDMRMNKFFSIRALFYAGLCFLFLSGSSEAATFTVDRTDDAAVSACTVAANDCSFRGAITAANTAAGDDIIDFDVTVFATAQTISLTMGELTIVNNGTITVNGTIGTNLQTISGGNISRVFFINSGADLTLNLIAIEDGNGTGTAPANTGGGIYSNGGTLTLNSSRIANNNSASIVQGGGFYMNAGTVAVNNSTIVNNAANSAGGGLFKLNGTLTVNNSTISGNSSPNGAGILHNGGGATLTGVTVANNAATTGGGVFNAVGTLNAGNSIFGDNTGSTGPDFNGTLTSLDFNLIENTSGTTISLFDQKTFRTLSSFAANDITGVDPMLGPLQNNTGPTQTHSLLTGSPAIDAGNSFGLTVDQRGLTRPIDIASVPNGAGDFSDIGAFEAQAPTAAAVSIGGRVLSPRGTGVYSAIVFLTNQNGETISVRTNPFGYYNFRNIGAGQIIIVRVFSKRYQYSPIVVFVTEELTTLNLVPE